MTVEVMVYTKKAPLFESFLSFMDRKSVCRSSSEIINRLCTYLSNMNEESTITVKLIIDFSVYLGKKTDRISFLFLKSTLWV